MEARERYLIACCRLKDKLDKGIEKILNFCFDNSKYRFISSVIVLILIDYGMLFFNGCTPLVSDDFIYSYKYNTYTTTDFNNIIPSSERVASLKDVFESQYMHYFAWGGRSVVHALVQFFLMYDKSVFNIANTAAYILLLAIICAHILGRHKWVPGLIIVINAALFVFTPAFGQDFLWLTGSCNYLWGGLLSFSYLLAFRFQMEREEPIISKLLPSILFGLWGIICAWTNENIAVTMVVLAVLFNIYTYIRRGKCYRWSIFATIGMIIGATMMIGAPGNFVRLEYENSVSSYPGYMARLATITLHFFYSHFLLIPMTIILICYIARKNENIDAVFWFYAIGLVVSMYSMVAAPCYTERAKLGSLIFVLIMAGRLWTTMEINQIKFRKLWAVLVIAAIAQTGMNFILGGHYIIEYNNMYQARMEIVSQAKVEGNLDPILPEEISQTKFCAAWGLFKLKMDSNDMWNRVFAHYYGLNSVRTETDLIKDVSLSESSE